MTYTRGVSDLVLDPDRSRVRIHTYAEGLLARLAHDLELVCGDLTGSGSRTADGGTARVEARLGAMTIAGTLHDDRVNESGLSPSDKHDALEKMKKEVFHAGADARVVVEAALERGTARVKLTPPNGRIFEATAKVDVEGEGDGARAKGSFDVSLAKIGSDPVKGPMGAFRIKDRVVVLFDLVFAKK